MGINFQNVKFKYNPLGDYTINDVSFNISSKDEFIFILAHTGSGKSTIVQNMNALLLPTGGNVYVYDKMVISRYKSKILINTKKARLKYNLDNNHHFFTKTKVPVYSKNLKTLRSHIGLVFQFPEYQLFETTVLKDVMFGPKNFGKTEEEALKNSKEALMLVGLESSVFDKSPFTLSGGQMRRVAIAGILALDPDIIILDEPTVGLDPRGKSELMELLVNIQNKTHKSIIMISHDMNIVAEYAKRIMVMKKGNLVFDGSKRELFSDIDKLHEFNLNLPNIASIAVKLENRGLISYKNIPLTKQELIDVILKGNNYE